MITQYLEEVETTKDVHDQISRKSMDRELRTEKSRKRIEKRTAYTTDDIKWLPNKDEWEGLKCIGAVHTEFEVNGGKIEELISVYLLFFC